MRRPEAPSSLPPLLRAIPLELEGDAVDVAPGSALAINVSVRRTCFGGGHASGTVRLWYNGAAIDSGSTRGAASRFDAHDPGVSTDFFLCTGFALSATAGTSRTFVDAAVNSLLPCPDRPYTSFGTWSMTLPEGWAASRRHSRADVEAPAHAGKESGRGPRGRGPAR